jgi:hypothetical protein
MDDGEMSASSPGSARPGPASAPTEAELSRMAREAVRQPPDPRLDKQLQRMGLADSPGAAADASARSDAEVERLQRRVRRLEALAIALAIAVGVLVVIEAIQRFA